MDNSRQRVWLSWASVGLLVLLCGALAVLQYRWIGKTTEAERNRLHGELHSRLIMLSREFNEELASAGSMRDAEAQRLLPGLLRRYLSVDGKLDYEAEVVENGAPATKPADDSIALFDIRPDGGPGPGPPPERDFGGFEDDGPPPPADGGPGRWRLFVRHRAGSLEALVEQTRRRNLAISAGILLLILAAVAALARFTRRAQQLAQLQMDFVAGVSHELRTPLTVIRTAAFNLRGKLATRPDQVERYGALIQAESEKLEALVEQALRFASIEAGHAIRTREPLAIDALIGEELGLEATGGPRVEKDIEAGLPRVIGDGVAMRHAIRNLLDNALKHGRDGNWIGLRARAVTGPQGAEVEIRVADRGPGIPAEEQRHIFDPFFRGGRALRDQVHGTGLGLSLAKKIVEAHGGTIRVKSEPGRGAEFIVRIPSAPLEFQNERAHSIS
jgi:signal transduction histidine kinase